jgi:hypothetical protein
MVHHTLDRTPNPHRRQLGQGGEERAWHLDVGTIGGKMHFTRSYGPAIVDAGTAKGIRDWAMGHLREAVRW